MAEVEASIQREPITTKKVVDQYTSFQKQVTTGFPTEQARLGAYETLLGETFAFFNQPNIASGKDSRAKTVIDRLFGETQGYYTSVQVDFFQEVKEKLHEQKNIPVRRWLGKKMDPLQVQVSVVTSMLESELADARRGRVAEQNDGTLLDQLKAAAPEDSDAADIEEEMAKTKEREKRIKQTAVDTLARDPHFRDDIERIADYKIALAELLSNDSPVDIQAQLAPYSDLLVIRGESVYESLLMGNDNYVQRTLSTLKGQSDHPDFVWNALVSSDEFPTELYQSFEELTTMVELGELARQIEGKSKELKAHYLSPFIEKGISATLLREIAEDRFSIPDDFVARQIETYVEFSDNYLQESENDQRKRSKYSAKRRLAAATLAAAAIALPIAVTYSDLTIHTDQRPVSQYHIPVKHETTPVQTTQAPPSSENFVRPDNTPANEFLSGQDQILWQLSGSDFSGFYQTATAPEFDPTRQGWQVIKDIVPPQQHAPIDISANFINMYGTQTITSTSIDLPIKPGQGPTEITVRDSQTRQDITDSFTLEEASDGTYFLQTSNSEIGNTVTITYDMGQTTSPTTLPPTEAELRQMEQQFISIADLPDGDFKTFMESIQSNTGMSLEDKATTVTAYIRDRFLYSLDTAVSDYYHQAPNAKEFFYRLFQAQKGDCDVVNSALAMALRDLGIPTRMAYGFNNPGGLLDLSSTSSHGIVQAYIGGRMIYFDATPTQADEYTQKALAGKMTPGSGLGGLTNVTPKPGSSDGETTPQNIDTGGGSGISLTGAIATMEHLLSESQILDFLLSVSALNTGALLMSMREKKRVNRGVARRHTELKRRAKAYLGPEYEHLDREITATERDKLTVIRQVKNVNPFVAIFPGAVIRWAKVAGMKDRLKKMPYTDSSEEIAATTTEPSITEFLTNALGYDRGYAEREIILRNHERTTATLQSEKTRKLEEAFKGSGIPSRRYRSIFGVINAMDRPTSLEEWEAIKTRTTERLYQIYTRGKKIDKGYDRAQFAEHMDEVYKRVLVIWQVDAMRRAKLFESFERNVK